MPMSKGAKIAIGCVVAFVGVTVVISIVIFGGLWWGANKVKQAAKEFAGDQERIERLKREADANPFTPPADKIIAEDRLVRFLDVRKKVFAVYDAHRAEFEAMGRRDKPASAMEVIDATRKAATLLGDVRLAQAQGLAEQQMSTGEYAYMVGAVYQTFLASEMQNNTGKSISESVGSGMDAAAQQAETLAQQAGLPEDQKEKLRESAAQMRQQAEDSRAKAAEVDVPQANIDLFRKYEADIRKYSMAGLETLGL